MSQALYPHAIRIAPGAVGVSPLNRLFSAHQVHNTILRSFLEDGFGEERAQVGICCEIRTPAKRLALQTYNETLSATSPLLPSVDPGAIEYEGLANTHYNVALRFSGQGGLFDSG